MPRASLAPGGGRAAGTAPGRSARPGGGRRLARGPRLGDPPVPGRRRDGWWLPRGASQPEPVLTTPFEERGIAVSPDGKWLAYVSNETGSDEVYVRSLPGPGGRVQISANGGREPRWGPGGRELLYRSRDTVYTTEIAAAGGQVRVGRHRALFHDLYRTGGAGNHAGWDVDASGRRFVFVRETGLDSERQGNVLLNQFDQPVESRAP